MTVIPFYSYHQSIQTQFQPKHNYFCFLSIAKLMFRSCTRNIIGLCVQTVCNVKKMLIFLYIRIVKSHDLQLLCMLGLF